MPARTYPRHLGVADWTQNMTNPGVATMHNDWSAGEIGGIFAGLVALLAAIGKGTAWVLNWQDTRKETRAARLKVWEQSLDRRERDQRDEMAAKFDAIERHVRASEGKVAVLAAALIDVTGALRTHAPDNPALLRSDAALRMAFPLEQDMSALLARLDEKDINP